MVSRPRNLVDQIISGKLRLLEDSDRYNQWFPKMAQIYEIYNHIKNEIDSEKEYRNELIKYIPIGMVASIQGYFSLAIRDIIDYGSPYRNNILKLKKDIKFEMEPILGVFDKKITLGEFVSALLPIRNLEVINGYMSSLLDIKFLDELRNQILPASKKGSQFNFADYADIAFANIPKLFEDRHIYCHELAPLVKLKLTESKKLFNSASLFVIATETLVSRMLSN